MIATLVCTTKLSISDIAEPKQHQHLKEKSGVKWIWDMFSMITSWNVRLGAKKARIDAFLSWLFLADSTKTL